MQLSAIVATLSLSLLVFAAPAPSRTTCWTNPVLSGGRITGIGFMLTAPNWHPIELTNFRTLVQHCELVSGSYRLGPRADEQHGVAYRMGVIPNDEHYVRCLEDAIDDAMDPKLPNPIRCVHHNPVPAAGWN